MCVTQTTAYLGRHYCKTCISRLPIRSPARDIIVPTPMVRAFDRVFSRWYAIPCLAVGLLLVAIGIGLVEYTRQSPPSMSTFRILSECGFHFHHANHRKPRTLHPEHHHSVTGAAATFAGRVSGRWAFFATLDDVACVLGVSAAVFISIHAAGRHEKIHHYAVRVISSGMLSETKVSTINARRCSRKTAMDNAP